MIKNALKVAMTVMMILGIAFSVFNFISIELQADPPFAAWVFSGGKFRCQGDGSDCLINPEYEEPW